MYDVYVITDEGLSNGLSHYEVARLACEGGADAIQLRDKSMHIDEMIRVAKDIRRVTSLHDVLFIVNDRLDVAIASEADGVHLGQSDIWQMDAATDAGILVGISASTLKEAVDAERDGADHIGFGPVFRTASKHDAPDALGLELMRTVRSRISVPVVAIGGITKDNAPDVIMSGADGIAVISAVVSQPDIRAATAELKDIVSSAKVRALKDRR
ncbi:MAG: thiamine phosphate synthase [Methanomassiliicoccaceae archaeon]|jgi:thiamine-phosphate pyrophosphorylase|nr:thiamine phosphate synthase [Methanomassiliicoccaceae archaeon]